MDSAEPLLAPSSWYFLGFLIRCLAELLYTQLIQPLTLELVLNVNMQVFHPLSQITNLDIAKGGRAFGLLQGMVRDYCNRGKGLLQHHEVCKCLRTGAGRDLAFIGRSKQV